MAEHHARYLNELVMTLASPGTVDHIWVGRMTDVGRGHVILDHAHNVRTYRDGGLGAAVASNPALATLDRLQGDGQILLDTSKFMAVIPLRPSDWAEALGYEVGPDHVDSMPRIEESDVYEPLPSAWRDRIVMTLASPGTVDHIWVGRLAEVGVGYIILDHAHNVRTYSDGGLATAAAEDPSSAVLDPLGSWGQIMIETSKIMGVVPLREKDWAAAIR